MRSMLGVLSALLLVACGQPAPDDLITVRNYTDARGRLTPHADALGFTYWGGDGSGAEHGTPGWNCLINVVLHDDADDDRDVRVIVHELGNVLVLDDGAFPEEMDGDWFLWAGSQQPYQGGLTEPEAFWFAQHGPYRVRVKDGWHQPTLEAINRVNVAAGVEVFVAEF